MTTTIQRSALLVALALMAVSFPARLEAQKCPWILNPGFEDCNPKGCGPMQSKNDMSAAANWRIHTDNASRLVTSVSTEGRGCCDGKKILTITCKGNESGVYQMFTPPKDATRIRVRACVRVKKGNVMLFVAKDGFANEATSIAGECSGRWTILELETKGDVLNNWVGVYNQSLDGGQFDIDYICVEQIK